MNIGLALEVTKRIVLRTIGVPLRKVITRKFRLEYPNFDDYPDPRVFSEWLVDIECYCHCYRMSDVCKVRFTRLRLVGSEFIELR